MEWIPVRERLPVKPGEYSEKMCFVQAQEFGCSPEFYVCHCWISVLFPNDPKWYLDRDFYNLDMQMEVGSPVLGWIEMPEPMPYPGPEDQMKLLESEEKG